MTKIFITEITDDNRDDLVKLAMLMYLGEACPYCMVTFETLDDLHDAVYNGETEYGRIAHKKCFQENNQ